MRFVQYKNNIYFVIVMASLLAGIELLSHRTAANYTEIVLTPLLLALLSCLTPRYRRSGAAILLLFAFADAMSYLYFHAHLHYYQIGTLFNSDDLADIFVALQSILPVLAAGLILLFAGFYLIQKIDTTSCKSAPFILLLLMITVTVLIFKKPYLYISSPRHLSYINTFLATELYIRSLFITRRKTFKPYQVKKVSSGKHTVILILGESLNARRMHLLGSDFNSTPYLDRFATKAHNFIYKEALSSGVNTGIAMTLFFNLRREPENIEPLLNQKTNLLRLARQNGYHTYWFSMQDIKTTMMESTFNYVDKLKQRDAYPKDAYDDILLQSLKDVNLTQKNFIVLHLRANHAPYPRYTPSRFYRYDFHTADYHKKMCNGYIDSVLFVDRLLYDIFSYFEKRKDFSVCFLSDHGEMLGFKEEHGRYGHSQLDINCAYIPFLYYSDGAHRFDRKYYNHYLIGKIVARDLGYEIINPNDDNHTYYINNVNKIDGSNGYIEYRLDPFRVVGKHLF